MNGEKKDRAEGWISRWAKRYLLYTLFTLPMATLVFMPWYVFVLRFTWLQVELLLLTTTPYSLAAYFIMAPWGKTVWKWIWRMEHRQTLISGTAR